MNFGLMNHKWFRILAQFFGAVAILIIWIVYETIPQLEQYPNLKISTSLALIMVYLGWILWILDTNILKATSKRLEVHENDNDWASWVKTIIKGKYPTNAYFVEYSGEYARSVIKDLLKHKFKVTLIRRNPKYESDIHQRKKINNIGESLDKILQEYPDNFSIQYYSQPGSIRIRYIEKVVVAFGWYTYEIKESSYDDKNKNVVGYKVLGDENLIISCTPECDLWVTMEDFAKQKIEKMGVKI
jgi:hypothetical protein